MSFRHKLLGSAAALLLIGAVPGAAFAQQSIQDGSVAVPDRPTAPDPLKMDQRVVGTGENDAVDEGSRRFNYIFGDYSNGMLGISHDQQNNGNNNAIGVTTNVLLNTGNDDDITQDLGIRGVSRNGMYSDEPSNPADPLAYRKNLIENAYQDVRGVFDVQQNNGDGNVMAIGDVVSANLGPDPFAQNSAGHRSSTQNVHVSGLVKENNSTDTNFLENDAITGERINTINELAFHRFLGLASVQQNNGNGNVIQVGTAVVGDIGSLSNSLDDGDTSLSVMAEGTVRDVTADSTSVERIGPLVDRKNLISNAFRGGVMGIVNAQQNNGDNNSMNVANAVRAAVGAGNDIDAVAANNVWAVGTVTSAEVGNFAEDNYYHRDNEVSGNAFREAKGLFTLQQNNGNNNAMNVATGVVASLFSEDGPGGDNETSSLSGKAQGTVHNSIAASTSTPGASITPADRDNEIDGNAFRGAMGIANAQQNNGDNNSINIANAVRVAKVSEGDIDGVAGENNGIWAVGRVTGNQATDTEQNRDNHVGENAFREAKGMFTVQQNNGDNNAMNSATGVVASLFSGSGDSDDVTAGAAASAVVSGNTSSVTLDSDRRNRLNGNVFNDAAGIATVQQNNGDNNVIGASKAIVVAVGTDGFTGFNGDIVADTQLSATVTGNMAYTQRTIVDPGYENLLYDSFEGFKGVKTVQQNNGNNNAIQSVVTVVGNLSTGGVGPGPGGEGL